MPVRLPAFCLLISLLFVSGCGSSTTSGSSTSSGPKAPTANAGGPYAGLPLFAVNFTAAASSDPQGQLLTYSWNFGDNSTGTGVAPTHSYAANGTYTITVTVTDTAGLTSTATSSAVINAKAPTAVAGGPYSGKVNSAIAMAAYGSSDPQTQTLSYTWNFGDGSRAYTLNATHTYTAPGKFSVTLAVQNQSGISATATTTATVSALPPTANAGGPYSGPPTVPVTFTAAASADPQSQTLTYAWNFGDGGTGIGVNPTHTYSAPGTYTVGVTATNTSGLSATASSTAAIAYEAPTANAGGPYTSMPNTMVGFNASVSTDPQNQALAYAWTFGDGSTGTGATPTHVYSTAGNYTATVTVTDTATLSASASTTVYVEAPGAALGGAVRSGATPVAGSHVYLFAAGIGGYGAASVPLLTSSVAPSSDAVGNYVATTSNRSFSIPVGYACPIGSQLYVYALGGTIGSNTNAAAGFLAAIGPCGTAFPSVAVNEVTTVATAYALAGFTTDPTHISSSANKLAQTGVLNSFSIASNLANPATGAAVAKIPSGNASAPEATINTLANLLNACASSASSNSTACSMLFTNAKSAGTTGTVPGDTAAAIINIAHVSLPSTPPLRLSACSLLRSSTRPTTSRSDFISPAQH